MKQKTRTNIFWKVKARDKVSPARLFADTDRDGVANVFDCRPFNPRRQDADIEKMNPRQKRDLEMTSKYFYGKSFNQTTRKEARKVKEDVLDRIDNPEFSDMSDNPIEM